MTTSKSTAPRRGTIATSAKSRRNWTRILVVLVTTLGICLLMFPAATKWWSSREHGSEVAGYAQHVATLPSAKTDELLAKANEYNHSLPGGKLRDAYSNGSDGDHPASAAFINYSNQLNIPGTDAMARVSIPSIDVDLPVYHGTDDATLARGVGHLYGSSLPVGGKGTHAVLTGHSGIVTSALFNDLDQVKKDDVITVSVAGEELHYQVREILTVLPDETDSLQKVPGSDLLSLVTCTPIGVNTHRLLVQAERVESPPPAPEDAQPQVLEVVARAAGFPWWILVVVAVPMTTILLTRPRRAPKNSARRESLSHG